MIKAKTIIKAVSIACDIPIRDLLGRKRNKETADARQITVYLLRELLNLSFVQIGVEIGGKDHTTIIYAYKKISHGLTNNSVLKNKVGYITNIVSNLAVIDETSHEKNEVPKKLETSDDLNHYFKSNTLSDRENTIINLYRKGLTLEEISKDFNITRERIRQIIKKGFMKELAIKGREGYKIIITEYLDAEKNAHRVARSKIPDNIRKLILKDISLFKSKIISLSELSTKYRVSKTKIEKIPEYANFIKKSTDAKKSKWSWNYIHCRKCKTTNIPHMKNGLCERCIGVFRKPARREKIILTLGNHCSKCRIKREDAIVKFSRDLYVSKSFNKEGLWVLLCKACFLSLTGKKLSVSKLKK